MKRPASPKYHVLIAAACFVVVSFSIGLGYNCWSVLTIPVCEGLGITRQQYSAVFTMIMLGMTVSALLMDRLFHRFGMMRVVRTGAVLVSAALLAVSRVHSVWLLYLGAFVIGLALITTGFVTFSMIIANWFLKYRGLVTGISFMGSALVSIFITPLIGGLANSAGWRTAMTVMGISAAVLCVPLCFFVVRERPEDVGLSQLADGSATEEKTVPESGTGFLRRELVRMPMFWLFIVFMFGTYIEIMPASTTVPHMSDVGYKPEYASLIWSCCMASLAIFRIFLGFSFDRLGVYKTTMLAAVLTPASVIGLLLVAGHPWSVALMILGMGVGESLTVVGAPLIVGELFGRRDYTRIYGVVTAISQIAGMLGPLAYGAVYTAAGTYSPFYVIAAGIYAAGFVCLLAALALRRKVRLPQATE